MAQERRGLEGRVRHALSARLSALGPQRLSVTHVAAGLIAVQVLLHGWTLMRGFFYLDDFVVMSRSMGRAPLDPQSWPQELPGVQVWGWFSTRILGLSHGAVALILLALQTMVSVLFVRLLLRLFGARPLILVPLSVACLAPLGMPGVTWWSSAMQQLPLQLSLVLALVFLVSHVESGQTRHAVLSVVAACAGLAFTSQAVLVEVVVLGTGLAWWTTGPFGRRTRELIRRHRLLWSGHAAVLAIGLMLVAARASTMGVPRLAGREVADLVMTWFFKGTIPGLFGGPYQWAPMGVAGAIADPSPFVVLVLAGVALVVVGGSSWLVRRAGRGWLALAGYLTTGFVLFVLEGGGAFGAAGAQDLRHQASVPLAAGFLVAWVMVPLAPRWSDTVPDRPLPRPSSVVLLQERVLRPLREAGVLGRSTPVIPVLTVWLIVLTTGAAWSQRAYDPWWTNNPARAWVTQALVDLDTLAPNQRVASTPVPEYVLWSLASPDNQSLRVLSSAVPPERRAQLGQSSPMLFVFDDEGHVRTAGVLGARADAGPVELCGWGLGASTVIVPLEHIPVDEHPVVRIGYVASVDTSLPVRIGTEQYLLDLRSGWNVVYLPVTQAAGRLTFLPSTPTAEICTDDISVGALVPIPGSAP